jgi:glycosyltransferase involved in cell wall biosynthesis
MPIKIARIITRMDLGGAQQAVLSLGRGLDKTQFEQILITGEGGLLLSEVSAVPSFRHYIVPELRRNIGLFSVRMDLKAILSIRNILRKEKALIVHTHTPKAGIIGRWAARLAGVPVIVHTYHGFGFSDSMVWWKKLAYVWIERMTARVTTGFVAVSENNLRKGEIYGLFRRQTCDLIRSGIEVSTFQRIPPIPTSYRMELSLVATDRIVGTIASLKPPKALHLLLKVAKMVSAQVADVKFVIVGDGELRTQLETQIRELRLESVVRLLGWRRDISKLLRLFDLFVLTSLWEGLPRVLVEASLAGVPVVAFDVDGVSEVVVHGRNGYLVTPGDLDAMTRRIVELLRNEDLRKNLGRESCVLADEFSVERMLEQHAALYLRFVSRVGLT